jgi:hypothetical protein
VQLDLLAAVASLATKSQLSNTTKMILVKLISTKDKRLVAAHAVWCEYKDDDDLQDTLLRVVRAEERYMMQTQAEADDDSDEEEEVVEPDAEAEDDDEDDMPPPPIAAGQPKRAQLLDVSDQCSIIDSLAKANHLNALQTRYLKLLIEKEDSSISAIFYDYEQDKDVFKLMQTLQNAGIASHLGDDVMDDEADAGVVEDEDDDEEEEDYEAAKAPAKVSARMDEEDRETIERRFLTIVQTMELSKLETAALRLAISRNDPSVSGCLERFKTTRNEDELIADLRRISRSTIDRVLEEQGYELNAPRAEEKGLDGDEDEDDVDVEDSDDSESDEEEVQPTPVPTAAPRTAGQQRGEGEQGIMSPATRHQMFPVLVKELVREDIMGSDEALSLVKLFEGKDSVVHAALDVYDVDSDMAELVDTLKKTAVVASLQDRRGEMPSN